MALGIIARAKGQHEGWRVIILVPKSFSFASFSPRLRSVDEMGMA